MFGLRSITREKELRDWKSLDQPAAWDDYLDLEEVTA